MQRFEKMHLALGVWEMHDSASATTLGVISHIGFLHIREFLTPSEFVTTHVNSHVTYTACTLNTLSILTAYIQILNLLI